MPTNYTELLIQVAANLFDVNKQLVILGFFPSLIILFIHAHIAKPEAKKVTKLILATYLTLASILVLMIILGFARLSVSPKWLGSEILC